MRPLAALFAALAFWSAVGATSAALALDPEVLRQDLKAVLDNGTSSFGPGTLAYDGLSTAARGETVRVKISGLRLGPSNMEGTLDLGDVAFTVTEGGERLYRVSEVQTSSKATLLDTAGNQAGFVNYDLERFSGVWSSAILNFLDLDFSVKRLELVVPEGGLAIALAEVTLENKTIARSDGLSDITSNVQVFDLRALVPNAGSFEIREIQGAGGFEGYDMAAYQAAFQDFQALAVVNPSADQKELSERIERLSDLNLLPQSFSESVTILGLSVAGPNAEPVMSLEEIELDMVGGDLREPLGRISLGMRYAGMQAMTPVGQAVNPLQDLMPSDAGMVISVERVPTAALWRTLLEAMAVASATANQAPGQTPNTSPGAGAMGQALGLDILKAINQAHSLLRLDRLELRSPAGRVSASGQLEADPEAATGAKGRIDMTITGLDVMLAIASSAASAEGGAPGSDLGMLMLLKSMAKRDTAADGSPIDRFEILLTPAGEILINGQPFFMAPPQ